MKDSMIFIFYSEKDRLYVADAPDLECCSAVGETPGEALREFLIAREAWMDSAASLVVECCESSREVFEEDCKKTSGSKHET